MNKVLFLCALYSLITQSTIIEKIPPQWLKDTTFYLQDKSDSMLLGRLFMRLDNKKMNMGQFLAELIQIIHAQLQTNKQLEARIAKLESLLLKSQKSPLHQ